MAEVRLINANALCQHIQDWNTRCQVLDVINDTPTIDPENLRPVVHWDMEKDAVGDPIIWTCSNCKDSIVMYDGAPMEKSTWERTEERTDE